MSALVKTDGWTERASPPHVRWAAFLSQRSCASLSLCPPVQLVPLLRCRRRGEMWARGSPLLIPLQPSGLTTRVPRGGMMRKPLGSANLSPPNHARPTRCPSMRTTKTATRACVNIPPGNRWGYEKRNEYGSIAPILYTRTPTFTSTRTRTHTHTHTSAHTCMCEAITSLKFSAKKWPNVYYIW